MDFDLQPIITGERFAVRPLRADDYASLFAAASDPLIWEQHPEKRDLPDVFREFFDERLASGGALLITDPATGEVLGTTSFDLPTHRTGEPREVEIGWTFLVRSRWGGPTNAELKHALLEHAFRYVDVVSFMVAPNNFRSQRAVEKIGGVRQDPRLSSSGGIMEYFTIAKGDFRSTRG